MHHVFIEHFCLHSRQDLCSAPNYSSIATLRAQFAFLDCSGKFDDFSWPDLVQFWRCTTANSHNFLKCHLRFRFFICRRHARIPEICRDAKAWNCFEYGKRRTYLSCSGSRMFQRAFPDSKLFWSGWLRGILTCLDVFCSVSVGKLWFPPRSIPVFERNVLWMVSILK